MRNSYIHPEDIQSVNHHCDEAIRRGEEHELEYRLTAASGETVWIHDVVSVELTDGEPHYLVGFMIDITARKQLEKDLIQTLGNLDHKVNERTTELQARLEELEMTRTELIQSEKMASLGRMVAGFAHEVNTPIGVAVSGSSGALDATDKIFKLLEQEEVDEEELLRLLAIIKQMNGLAYSNLKRAAKLIGSFKRTTIDQSSDQPRIFNLHDSLADVISSLRSTTFKRNTIDIHLDLSKDLNIFGLPGVIDQIITNLMINSLRYGFDEGRDSGNIDIKAEQIDDTLQLTYRDDGVGMSPENLERAFEPFYTTGRSIGGSGLGLYICYNLVTNRLGGTIGLESTPGQGVEFTIRFNLSEQEQLQREAMADTAS